MTNRRLTSSSLLAAAAVIAAMTGVIIAHPLGNFTINHYARIEASGDRINIRYVIDMAEIPAFQELQSIDADATASPSSTKLKSYAARSASKYAEKISLTVDGVPVRLQPVASNVTLPRGAGGLPTLRLECDFKATLSASVGGATHRIRFEDGSYEDRIGWREIIVAPATGWAIFDSSAFGTGLTDELKAYPEDSLAAPLDERSAEFSLTRGAVPAGAAALLTRDGHPASESRDRFAELIAVPNLTPLIALIGLLIAASLGALHALSPGHGKTIVGAYLVGSKGTARHAAFLGMTVTITHTFGVFALGLVTLFASQYVVPERLFPILSLISGGIVLVIGLSLFIRRLRSALKHSRGHEHSHDHPHHDHNHSHDGETHSHLPPEADEPRISLRSLLALGISGGLLPCPSALVVLLSAISLHRVGYGLILVIAFSLGLATTLTAVGLAFVYAGRLIKRPVASSRLVRVLPVVSALVIACAGAAICYEALLQAGINITVPMASLFRTFTASMVEQSAVSTVSVLTIGLVFGLKHAVEADHIAAVSTIVSERKSLLASSLVGGLWGVGHTISLLIAGVAVLLLHVKIGERTALALEFCVALMLIALGVNALRKMRRGGKLHLHAHHHGNVAHFHPHIHDSLPESTEHTHHGLQLSARPLLIGMVHGLAGSAALMLLVLSTISSPAVGLAYIAVFGVGSIGGMIAMSVLVSLPVHLTAGHFNRANQVVRTLAALFSLGLGLFMAYRIGFVDYLFRP
ncbi:MAG TPA: sulfite exporter TauE/SafE family protein [Blastocatellia bacterium]